MFFGSLRVHVHIARGPREPDPEKIIPTVLIEVINEPEKIVRIPVAILRLGRINLMLRLVIGPGVPVGARDNVRHSIMGDITKISALTVVLSGKGQTLESVKFGLSSNNLKRTKQQN